MGRRSKYQEATPGDAQWTREKQRCYDLLVSLVGGVHHLGTVRHFGSGLRASYCESEASTFDGDLLTWIVLLAHQRHCRVAVENGGPRRIAITVFARKPEGDLCSRHPGLAELRQRIDKMMRANGEGWE
jgi:hypothetical protein